MALGLEMMLGKREGMRMKQVIRMLLGLIVEPGVEHGLRLVKVMGWNYAKDRDEHGAGLGMG